MQYTVAIDPSGVLNDYRKLGVRGIPHGKRSRSPLRWRHLHGISSFMTK
jgi:hypothetical protein